jgi:hypothetical protein
MGNFMEKRFIGIDELGQYLDIKPQTIRNRLSAGTFLIRAFKICGRLRFDTRDVERYLIRLRSCSEGNTVDSERGVCDTTS